MKVRPYDREKDEAAVREMYEHRDMSLRLNPADPLNMAALVAEDDNGKVVGYFVARPTVELHTVVDDGYGRKSDRFKMIMDMSHEMARQMDKAGMPDAVFSCLPPYSLMTRTIAGRYDGITERRDPYCVVKIKKFLGNWKEG